MSISGPLSGVMSVSMIASSARIMEAVNAKVEKRGENIVEDDVSLALFESWNV